MFAGRASRCRTVTLTALLLFLVWPRTALAEDPELRLARSMRLAGILTFATAQTASLVLGALALSHMEYGAVYIVPPEGDPNATARGLGLAALATQLVALVVGVPLWDVGQKRINRLRDLELGLTPSRHGWALRVRATF